MVNSRISVTDIADFVPTCILFSITILNGGIRVSDQLSDRSIFRHLYWENIATPWSSVMREDIALPTCVSQPMRSRSDVALWDIGYWPEMPVSEYRQNIAPQRVQGFATHTWVGLYALRFHTLSQARTQRRCPKIDLSDNNWLSALYLLDNYMSSVIFMMNVEWY